MSGTDENGAGASVPADEVLIDAGAPPELSEFGKRVWVSETPGMLRAGRLKDTDRSVWMRYCQLVGDFWEAEHSLTQKGGRFYQVPTTHQHKEGVVTYLERERPESKFQRSILPEIRQLEDRLARSPLARANLISKGLGGAGAGSDLFGEGGYGGGDDNADRPDPASFN
ncbi:MULTISPECIES: P27 family phage terminase small subunit [Hyphomonas]|uniref:Phage terminase small subunit P27 family n=1 Tax=Hyphomonas adhaerens TaxID=81029 RepID=A0A3B9GVP6_9PROT|nr:MULTISPECIES: P27 family phage terminase small subunit [Hyphomonas]MBB40968.1 hypothetical protein [Hyphomonas sp.]HAE26535.1 hypothetical protein [Hyphomonas adhaerens]|tara:strand:+ start:84 stop:590 length:507 start_codon:yes stop_codon:yes gene_type:complete